MLVAVISHNHQSVPPPDRETNIVSSETERIGERKSNRALNYPAMRVLKVALWIRCLEIDGRRNFSGPTD